LESCRDSLLDYLEFHIELNKELFNKKEITKQEMISKIKYLENEKKVYKNIEIISHFDPVDRSKYEKKTKQLLDEERNLFMKQMRDFKMNSSQLSKPKIDFIKKKSFYQRAFEFIGFS